MYPSEGSLILEMGEIGVVARSCEAAGMSFDAPVPTRRQIRSALLILGPEDTSYAYQALRAMSERSVLLPGRGVRRRDVLDAQYMLDNFVYPSSPEGHSVPDKVIHEN
jgi:hypothetical protein